MDEPPTSAASNPDFSNLCLAITEHAPSPMATVEGAGHTLRYVNPAFCRLMDQPTEQLVGRRFADMLPSDGECLNSLDRVFRTGKSESHTESQDSKLHPSLWSYTLWPVLPGSHPAGVMIQVNETGQLHDQTVAMNEALVLSAVHQHELAETAEATSSRLQLEVSEKEYFIAILSHELRTPLTPVLLAVSLLQEDQNLTPETREIMRMIHRNVTLETRLIDDLLDMTRMERGKLNLNCHPVDLRTVLDRSIEVVAADMRAGGLTLEKDTDLHPQIVNADATRLQQVFSNLLRNAIKFTPVGGNIRVRSRCDGTFCIVEVTDDGAGIDSDFLPRAFGAFEQGDRSTSRKPGLGLGLTICKTIVDLHGGYITGSSNGTNLGATFIVKLPTLAGIATVPQENRPPARAPLRPVRSLRVLVVEDHADTGRTLCRILRLDGHTVQWATSVSTALELVRLHSFDLLLSDLGLPDGSGLDIMNSLRQGGSNLPGIVISGFGLDQDVAKSRAAGFALHLIKPLTIDRIQEAIAAVMN